MPGQEFLTSLKSPRFRKQKYVYPQINIDQDSDIALVHWPANIREVDLNAVENLAGRAEARYAMKMSIHTLIHTKAYRRYQELCGRRHC